MKGWALVDLVRHAEIKPAGLKDVVKEIALIQGGNRNAWPTVEYLAGLTGLGESTVKAHTKTAAERGLIRKTRRWNNSNLYEVCAEAIRALPTIRDSQNPDVQNPAPNTHTPTSSQNLDSNQIRGPQYQASPIRDGDALGSESDTIGGLTWEQIDEYPPYADSSPEDIPEWAGPEAAHLASLRSVPDSTPATSRTSPAGEATHKASPQWTGPGAEGTTTRVPEPCPDYGRAMHWPGGCPMCQTHMAYLAEEARSRRLADSEAEAGPGNVVPFRRSA